MIDVSNVTKYYGDFCAVNDLSFSIQKGEITGLLGPNGAGKTTTMRMITGYLNSTSGKITIGGEDIKNDPVAIKKKIGYLPETAPLYEDMLVLDYLRYVADMHNVTKEGRIDEISKLCGLLEVMHKNIHELSRGYRQRVGLAHAMIHDPDILILDEPTSGLDPNQIIEVRNLIKEIGKTKTVIISTHILPEVEMLCGRVIIINQGKIVADNKTSELQATRGEKVLVNIQVECPSFNEFSELVKNINGIKSVVEMDNDNNKDLVYARISSSDETDVRPNIFKAIVEKGWVLYEMTQQQNTLEDVFRDLTVGAEDEK